MCLNFKTINIFYIMTAIKLTILIEVNREYLIHKSSIKYIYIMQKESVN